MRFFTRVQLDRAFEPRSIAVIGAQKRNNYLWLHKYERFAGTVSSVHTNPRSIADIEAMGIRNYSSIRDVPRPVDYVVVNTSRNNAERLFEECIEAGVGAVSFFTSGFAETDAEGRALQERLAKRSRESGVAIFGPNCTGAYNPERMMPTAKGMPLGERGPVGMVSQSGTHASYFAKALSAWYGIREARGISFGNAAVLDAADWIEYIGEDERVRVLASYIEGIGDRERGDYERFVATLARVAVKKPVVIWKGGNSADGARVTAAHTGSKAVHPDDWRWILDSTGAIGVGSMEELVDTVAMLVKLPPARGPRAGFMILTGGQGIAIADCLARHGLRVPDLTPQSYAELKTFFNPIGGGYVNPLDSAYTIETPADLARQLALLDRDENVDFVLMDLFGQIMSLRRLKSDFGVGLAMAGNAVPASGVTFLDILERHATTATKPFFMTVTPEVEERGAIELRELLTGRGILAVPGIERAARAYARVQAYWAGRLGRASPLREA